jgi:TetR/AcrR family acrAB operon transcriptional repressor
MRRTKEDAELTKQAILDAAERMFCDEGYASATLEKISRAAGVTRGAFYWHFRDKHDLLRAMNARYAPPQKQVILAAANDGHEDPLRLLEDKGIEMLALLEQDPRQQRMFQIMQSFSTSSECADWQIQTDNEMFTAITRLTSQARDDGSLSNIFTPQEASVMLMATMSGLIGEWLRSGKAFSLHATGTKILQSLTGLLRRKEEDDNAAN